MTTSTIHQFFPATISARSHPRFPGWQFVPPLPSPELMGTVGAPDVENFLVVGDAWSHVIRRFLGSSTTVLDVGCGCGRTARFLLNLPGVRYVGFDIVKPSIDWCNEELGARSSGRFRFHHLDVFSEHYNPTGTLKAGDVLFPCDAEFVDIVVGASLFTHLLEGDANHYLREIARVLRPGGNALLTILRPEDGSSFRGKEDRVEIDPSYFASMLAGNGLRQVDEAPEFTGQHLVIATR